MKQSVQHCITVVQTAKKWRKPIDSEYPCPHGVRVATAVENDRNTTDCLIVMTLHGQLTFEQDAEVTNNVS